MKLIKAVAFALLAMALIGVISSCGVRRYVTIPEGLVGNWRNFYNDQVRTLRISRTQVVIITEDGASRRCNVEKVRVRYGLFNESKETFIDCKKDSEGAVEMAKRCPDEGYLTSWQVSLKQDDSENDSIVDAVEHVDVSCDEYLPNILGSFGKQ